MQTSSMQIRFLKAGEEARLAELEKASWPEPLQASGEVILKRMDLGHTIIVAEESDTLVAALCYVMTAEDPTDRSVFPKSFAAYSSLPRTGPALSAYVYSLCVHGHLRGRAPVRRLLDAGISDISKQGATYIVGDGRCPSYAGDAPGTPAAVPADPAFRRTIERWRLTGVRPSDQELTRDPVLRFHKRMLECEFLRLAPDFFPEDEASGGYRVIFAMYLGGANR